MDDANSRRGYGLATDLAEDGARGHYSAYRIVDRSRTRSVAAEPSREASGLSARDQDLPMTTAAGHRSLAGRYAIFGVAGALVGLGGLASFYIPLAGVTLGAVAVMLSELRPTKR